MKKYLAPLAAVLLAGCSANSLNPNQYSFELTDKIIESTFEKHNGDGNTFTSCTKTTTVAYEVKAKPENFTGLVTGKMKTNINRTEMPNMIRVIDGKMSPLHFHEYASTYSDDKEYFKRVCELKSAADYKVEINKSTLMMIPGVHPAINDDKK